MVDSLRLRRAVLTLHVAATWFMVGLIWTIHVLHYPLLGSAGEMTVGSPDENIYLALQSEHVDKIGVLLFVPWLTEGVTLLVLLWWAFVIGERQLRVPAAMNAVAMAIVLAISGFWSAPAHGTLMDGFDNDVFDRLMAANLVRTLAWTVCGIAALWLLVIAWHDRTGRDVVR